LNLSRPPGSGQPELPFFRLLTCRRPGYFDRAEPHPGI